ncbi:MAG TPA: thioredoxin domain-containing protein [Anaerolineae bacterium]
MLERIAITIVLIGLGVLAYRLLLSAQRRQAVAASRRDCVGRPSLLVFTSPTCAPCKLQQMPIVNRLMDEWGDRISLRVIDVTEQPDMATRFGVWSLPTTIVLDGSGHVEAINQGIAGAVKLREQFERACQPAVNAPTNRPANQPAN